MKQGDIIPLLQAMRDHFAKGQSIKGVIGNTAKSVIDALSDLDHRKSFVLDPVAEWHGVLAHIQAFVAGRGDILNGALAPVVDLLPWRYSYSPRADAPDLGNKMGWAELVGPAAPIYSDKIGFGLTFISPDAHYFSHVHPAVELYARLSGPSLWIKEGVAQEFTFGSFVLHESNIVHAMETGAEALLAIYFWTGDIVSPTRYVCE